MVSSVFSHGGTIPTTYTCEGDNTSPVLTWSTVPPATKSLVVVVDDRQPEVVESTGQGYTHWIVYGIPATSNVLAEGASSAGLPEGAVQGLNDAGKATYSGPCPETRRHTYFFHVYATDIELAPSTTVTRAILESALADHVIAKGELMGTYERTARKSR